MYNPNLHFFFCGIGGVGMSGLAEILCTSGFRVSGSDLRESAAIERLRAAGARVCIGHDAAHLSEDVSLVVFSSAVSADNPELQEARRRGLPVIRRAEVLAELMRLKYGVGVAGSHGKTTTTSMIAALLEAGELDPTVVIGGQLHALGGGGGKLGRGEFLVAETDESDRSFLLLKPTVAVVTNIDLEHLNAYTSPEDLESSFAQFVASVPFYGLAVLCGDDPRVAALAGRHEGRKVVYGFSESAQLRAVNLRSEGWASTFEVVAQGESLGEVTLPMPGKHLVSNALAAIAVAREFGVSFDRIQKAFAEFKGVARRLEVLGTVGQIKVVNDYGHHPTEIRATLQALRASLAETGGRIHTVFQPHRYSRTQSCFDEFRDAFVDSDTVIMTEIYAAGEVPLPGIDGATLCRSLRHPACTFAAELDDAMRMLLARAQPGDVLLCLGAGSIGALPSRVLRGLELALESEAA